MELGLQPCVGSHGANKQEEHRVLRSFVVLLTDARSEKPKPKQKHSCKSGNPARPVSFSFGIHLEDQHDQHRVAKECKHTHCLPVAEHGDDAAEGPVAVGPEAAVLEVDVVNGQRGQQQDEEGGRQGRGDGEDDRVHPRDRENHHTEQQAANQSELTGRLHDPGAWVGKVDAGPTAPIPRIADLQRPHVLAALVQPQGDAHRATHEDDSRDHVWGLGRRSCGWLSRHSAPVRSIRG
mmetsp:Transcript_143457/g.458649  ORF Transcript_143457/g.458649 Transcript_143457/m.458649 type:complete len:236 (+) Transcript_143457:1003-1710(+)